MIIRVIALGDPDAAPLCCTFERGGDAEAVFAASVRSMAALLERGRRVNINQALLLLAARAAESLAGGEAQMRRDVSGVLSPDQVMIGVPEMTRKVTMEIETGRGTVLLEVHSPIAASMPSC